ncbi:CehA/McbA family metallohydrolase [Cohnella thailandensis]|uniref:CehA/McbA family metallohydrolase n=1 Tax=Cohnella thailandensis TaxID=557557 RepID=A0A841STE8_9BACL|nr:CehA/McbA family metallohydrolase [Cohnella thailandensis]MBB6633315.1 CehA/McbA family metallohydrolase [Cohnella thailandensis]MBP1977348.1 hypothetical protein [Cohnella thailandensis]
MRWLACELHTHTLHSDGKQTLRELADGAAKLGFECIALTDHNTMSGLADKDAVERETGLVILPGMEWTTFHGHMVTIGASEFADWRLAEPGNLREGTAAVRRRGGLAGLAHPFRIGSPACTGCFWEFEIRDWSDLDYIEVWSTTFAAIKEDNRRAFELWTSRLNAGDRIAATSGRDWHEQKETDDPLSVTYLGLADESAPLQEEALRALREGRVAVTIGPLLTLTVVEEGDNGAVYALGSEVPLASGAGARQPLKACADLRASVREGLWELHPQSGRLVLTSNKGDLLELSVHLAEGDSRHSFPFDREGLLWIRAELWGVVRGVHARIAFTNAIYFERGDGR